MIKKIFKNIDYFIYLVIILLFGIGIVGLYSASLGAGGNEIEFSRQITWFVVGFFTSWILIFIDYNHYKKVTIPIYVVMCVLLFAVLFSNPTNGATSWFKVGPISMQPGEFSKVVLILVLSNFVSKLSENDSLNKIQYLFLVALIVAVPTLLIIKQPDYGTAIVIMLISCAILYAGGIYKRFIYIAVAFLIVSVPLLYNFVLPEHAKTRIQVFLNPELDKQGAGYNITQSKLAVGSGQLTGMGFLNGNQTQLGMLPMKSTDFIFPVISEEFGFIASCGIVIAFVFLLYRLILIAQTTKDEFGKLICVGTFAMIFIHFTENIGMTIGLLPITGIPLPFISYGGSAMLTNFIAIGICESVAVRKKKHKY